MFSMTRDFNTFSHKRLGLQNSHFFNREEVFFSGSFLERNN